MDERQKTRVSKFLSLILRHKPETVGAKLDANGWIEIDALLAACASSGNALTRDELRAVVATNEKKRFAFDESETKIRASQGHSIAVEIEFEEKTPPARLFHGTSEKNAAAIRAVGLKKMRRHHVHLSADAETARAVGKRHGKPIVFEVKAEEMAARSFKFYVSANGVWLIERVPPEFLEIL